VGKIRSHTVYFFYSQKCKVKENLELLRESLGKISKIHRSFTQKVIYTVLKKSIYGAGVRARDLEYNSFRIPDPRVTPNPGSRTRIRNTARINRRHSNSIRAKRRIRIQARTEVAALELNQKSRTRAKLNKSRSRIRHLDNQ
jgi:hypothetical protein